MDGRRRVRTSKNAGSSRRSGIAGICRISVCFRRWPVACLRAGTLIDYGYTRAEFYCQARDARLSTTIGACRSVLLRLQTYASVDFMLGRGGMHAGFDWPASPRRTHSCSTMDSPIARTARRDLVQQLAQQGPEHDLPGEMGERFKGIACSAASTPPNNRVR